MCKVVNQLPVHSSTIAGMAACIDVSNLGWPLFQNSAAIQTILKH
jgi:hypothetical protein